MSKPRLRVEEPDSSNVVTLSVRDMPGVIADLRREMAKILIAEARRQQDDVVGWAVAKSLRAVAGAFKSGLSEQDFSETGGA